MNSASFGNAPPSKIRDVCTKYHTLESIYKFSKDQKGRGRTQRNLELSSLRHLALIDPRKYLRTNHKRARGGEVLRTDAATHHPRV